MRQVSSPRGNNRNGVIFLLLLVAGIAYIVYDNGRDPVEPMGYYPSDIMERRQAGDAYVSQEEEIPAAAPEIYNQEEDYIDPWAQMAEEFHEEKESLPLDHLSAVDAAFIKRFHATARMEQERYNIPYSIKMSQGILESDRGRSRVARNANNYYGIKTKGRGYNICDDDCNDKFKIYPSAWASWRGHSLFLTSNSRYAPLFADEFDRSAFARYASAENCLRKGKRGCVSKGKDPKFSWKLAQLQKYWNVPYKRFAYGLDILGYATDVNYSQHLIEMIERLQLHKNDK